MFAGRSARKASQDLNKTVPVNEMGLDFQRSQTLLLRKALKNPDAYYQLRDDIQQHVVEGVSEFVFNLVTKLLYDGQYPSGANFVQAKIDGDNFQPMLPHSQVEREAIKLTAAMAEQVQDLVDKILPASHLELANKKETTLSNVRNNLA